jgi:hypothetical protein
MVEIYDILMYNIMILATPYLSKESSFSMVSEGVAKSAENMRKRINFVEK